MATQQITLDKFGSENIARQGKGIPPTAMLHSGMPSSTGKQSHYGSLPRSASRSRQMTAPAESASEALGKSDGSTHVPLRSDGC